MSQIADRLSGLTEESLVVWRQVLAKSVRLSFLEAQSREVQGLVEAGLVFIRPETDCKSYTAYLSKSCELHRLSEVQRNLLAKMSEGPLLRSDYLSWAREQGLEHPLEFLQPLRDLQVIEVASEPGKVVLNLK